ncbi:hypothetical protein QBC35DRAFT_488082 [Podospora australis]|uniref:FAD-binding domain-containing protein n=1 Tax=Podospora australis TaxID=1536484 RepID=A0AAN6X450_9PEZI|nr:hypothetical protein QBC35DRAFT_488082 [Podospora australis]
MSPPSIAIIGAGPAGLTLARLLEVKGIDYVVFERDASPDISNRAGGSLDIHPETGQHALREAGLFEEFQKLARYEDTAMTIADKHGKRLLKGGEGQDRPEIDRLQLRQILIVSIPHEKIKWGHGLVSASLDPESNKPVLTFSNEAKLSGFKLVVGADGAWSKLRSLITTSTPTYTGKSYIETRITLTNPLHPTVASRMGAGMFIAIGDQKLVISQRQGDSSYRTYFGVSVPPGFFQSHSLSPQPNLTTEETETNLRNILLSDRFFADWDEEYHSLIKNGTNFRPWPLYSLSKESITESWKSVPGLTLIGDAAHLCIPNGEGVNLAMTDALRLAEAIAAYGVERVDKAVKEYEEDMFPRAIETITEGWSMADGMFGEGPEKLLAFMEMVAGGGER